MTHSLPIAATGFGSFELFFDVGKVAFRSRTVSNGLYETKVLVCVEKEEEV